MTYGPYTVFIDFDDDDDFITAGENISEYVLEFTIEQGIFDPLTRVADVGRCTLVLNNADKRFSPAYTSSPYYGNLLPNRKVAVRYDGTNMFVGYIRKITPEAGEAGTKRCVIECEDYMGLLNSFKLSLPLQENKTGDYIIGMILASAFLTNPATGTVTFNANVSNNDTVTIDGTTYTFKTALTPTFYEVLIGTAKEDTARNLMDAINNNADTVGTAYASGTLRAERVSASRTFDHVVEVKANARGTWGNAIALSTTAANIAVTATLSGGTDPVGPALEAGIQTFEIAADRWSADRTTAKAAITDIVMSELGYFWCDPDGALHFKNHDWAFIRQTSSYSNVVTNVVDIQGRMSIEDVFNRIIVSWQPRAESDLGVIAMARGPITVPGRSGYERWNGTEDLPDSEDIVVKIPYTDPDTGSFVGAKSVITPEADTDYTVDDDAVPPFDYTNHGYISVTMALNGGDLEASMLNTAWGPLVVRNMQVRGIGIIAYDYQQSIREDAASIAAYGVRDLNVVIPLGSGQAFIDQIAFYYLSQYSTPQFRVQSITVEDNHQWATMNFGTVLAITDAQLGISAQRYLYMGRTYRVFNQDQVECTLFVQRLDETNYGLWGNATYGIWGVSKWGL